MTPDHFRCTCSTCRRERIVESYDTANRFFDDHASRGHEVEIVRLNRGRTAVRAE